MSKYISKAQPIYVEVIEEPNNTVRFWSYDYSPSDDEDENVCCDGDSIAGVHSTTNNKTFPTIKIYGYRGRAVVVASCVTKDLPYKAHPHNLLGARESGFKSGICKLEFDSDSMTCSFPNKGIERIKEEDIKKSLSIRQKISVDPFKQGFDHRNQPNNIDLNAVRLAFQVFIEGPEEGKFKIPLEPIVSQPIFYGKATKIMFN